jgi:hypothetical protein
MTATLQEPAPSPIRPRPVVSDELEVPLAAWESWMRAEALALAAQLTRAAEAIPFNRPV